MDDVLSQPVLIPREPIPIMFRRSGDEDWLAGKVVALGRKYAIATPAQEAVYAILKPYRMGRAR